jgi:hypothetical protein
MSALLFMLQGLLQKRGEKISCNMQAFLERRVQRGRGEALLWPICRHHVLSAVNICRGAV